MKISAKFLGLAVVALTFVGGCTKKNISNSKPAQVKPKVDDKPVVDTPKPVATDTTAAPIAPVADGPKPEGGDIKSSPDAAEPAKKSPPPSAAIVIEGPLVADAPVQIGATNSPVVVSTPLVAADPKAATLPLQKAAEKPTQKVAEKLPEKQAPDSKVEERASQKPADNPVQVVTTVQEDGATETRESAKQANLAAQRKQPKATPQQKDDVLVAGFRDCFTNNVKKSLASIKAKKDSLVPNDLYKIKYASAGLCEVGMVESKIENLNSVLTEKVVELATSIFPKSTDCMKFFVETEAKKMDRAERKKVYEAYVSENKTTELAASTTAGRTNKEEKKATAVAANPKELEDFGKCLKEKSTGLIEVLASSGKSIEFPGQLLAMKEVLPRMCKYTGADQSELINKFLVEATLAKFPASKSLVDIYTAVDKENLSVKEKMAVFTEFEFPTGVELNLTKVRFQGVIEPSQASANSLTYTIKNYTGEKLVKVRRSGKEASNLKSSLNQMPNTGIRYVFNFSLKSNNTGTLTIIEGQTSLPLDFVFSKGSLAEFKTGKAATIVLTPESWSKVLMNDIQNAVVENLKGMAITDFVFAKDPKESADVRICEITDKNIECIDPDIKTKATTNPKKVIKK